MNHPIHLGVIGTGQAYHQLYRPALARCPEFSIVATADPAAEATHRSAEALLDSHELDGVIILSPARLHAEQVELAAARGIRVLVEKPPAVSEAEVNAWSRPELVTPAFSRRYWPTYRTRFPAGRRFMFRLETNPETWGAQSVESPVRDLLPHAADLAGWLSGSAISGVVEVTRTATRASGAFTLQNGARFDWLVGHGAVYAETASCDGTPLPSPTVGPAGELVRRLRRQPTVAVAGIAAMLGDWARTFEGEIPGFLPGIEAARDCARAIEIVESVRAGTPA